MSHCEQTTPEKPGLWMRPSSGLPGHFFMGLGQLSAM